MPSRMPTAARRSWAPAGCTPRAARSRQEPRAAPPRGARGVPALRAAAQDRRVPRHQAKRAGIGGHVGPRFVDDTDDADRHRHPVDAKPVGPLPLAQKAAERVVRAATCSTPAAIPSTRPGSRARRSSSAPLRPDASAAVMSLAFAFRIAASSLRIAVAAASERTPPRLGRACREHPRRRARLGAERGHLGGNVLFRPAAPRLGYAHGPCSSSSTRSSRWIISARPR